MVKVNTTKAKRWNNSTLWRNVLCFLSGLFVVVTIALSSTASSATQSFPLTDISQSSFVATEKPSTRVTQKTRAAREEDKDCIFRDSPLYRKVFVYPNPGEEGWEGDLLTEHGRNLTSMKWPWVAIDEKARKDAEAHYNIESQIVQYTTELLVREIMINPQSCLRTMDPEEADLFYVPYLPSTEHHMGSSRATDYSFSPYGRAIIDILDKQDHTGWEKLFGMTSKYWKRRNGSDHILVFSEPMHGLYHPRSRRGNFHFIHSQKQLTAPIVISVELSTAFVTMYPNCAAKNILVPYPNTHGGWFNGELFSSVQNRSISQFYSAGNHGTCTKLRRAMKKDYESCSPSNKQIRSLGATHFSTGMKHSIFCPCPGGDSPSAKRMFDSLIAGCVPVILSKDFVWPFTTEFDPTLALEPTEFSLRLEASDFDTELLDSRTCQPLDPNRPGLQAYLDAIPPATVEKLQNGAEKAGRMYSWYAPSPTLPSNPLREGILPDGGAAQFVVEALADRAQGSRWPACKAELERVLPLKRKDPMKFEC